MGRGSGQGEVESEEGEQGVGREWGSGDFMVMRVY